MSAFSIAFGFAFAGPLDGDICNCLLLTQIRIILQNQESFSKRTEVIE